MNAEFYPPTINRAMVLVIPKQAFFDWEKSVFPDSPSIQESISEYNSYLLKDSIMPDEPKKALQHDWQWIFENELFGICTDESTWPQKLTWKLFCEWFDVKFSSVIMDLVNKPIVREEI